MNEIRFQHLRIGESCGQFEWSVEPTTALYHRTTFTLDYSGALDPRTLPERMWWTAGLLCLHSHWNLLRPCRVILPITLPAGEIEFWQRLLDGERVTLEKSRGTGDFERSIEIECRGPEPAARELPPAVGRYPAAFSGGKDSLLQAGLLCELTGPPLLVMTRSEMPPTKDQVSVWRRRVLDEMSRRKGCKWVELNSDLRSGWWNDFSRELGYGQTVNEITDTFLYTANLLVVAAARGIKNICLASEYDLSETTRYHGRVAQYPEFMYSTITMNSLNALFSQWGISFSSVIGALTGYRNLELLRRRYPEIADLEISCWAVQDENQRACSCCGKCLRIAIVLLALDEDPATIGIDVAQVFESQAAWDPATQCDGWFSVPIAASRINLKQARRFFPERSWRLRLEGREVEPFVRLEQLVARCQQFVKPWVGKYHPAMLKYAPDELQAGLDAIFREACAESELATPETNIEWIDETVDWISQPLFENETAKK